MSIGKKWRVLLLLALAQLLAMSLWFSATAVTPALVEEWGLSPGNAAFPSPISATVAFMRSSSSASSEESASSEAWSALSSPAAGRESARACKKRMAEKIDSAFFIMNSPLPLGSSRR